MKPKRSFLLLISLPVLIMCCEKEEAPDNPVLSVDSLRILQTNIPGDLYTDLAFIDENTGIAISNSGSVIKTMDGGYSWEKKYDSGLYLSRIQFAGNQYCYIIGGDISGGYLLKTSDKGESWQKINLLTPDNVKPSGVYFLNSTEGFITGENLFRKTQNGGETWMDVMSDSPGNIYDVSFRNSIEGYAVSDNGKYYATSDGGKTWRSMQSTVNDHLKRIYFAGSLSLAKCRISKFVDLSSGNEIFTVPAGAFNFLFLNESRCVATGQHYEVDFLPYGDVFITNDAWSSYNQKKFTPQSEAMNVTSVSLVKNRKIMMIGSGTVNTSVIILNY